MNLRNYNVIFHLHTISGIVISVGLYIIFFAGAFTLFEHAIHHWEIEEATKEHNPDFTVTAKDIDYDRLLGQLKDDGYDLYGRSIYITLEDEKQQSFFLSASQDTITTKRAKESFRLKFDLNTYEISKQTERFSLATLLYWLHFFYQLDRTGYYISGIVSLFFLFAIVSGIVIHWKKIISNFFIFRPLAKLKTVWTDAHTALGTIGIPFQFMYALTGVMFGLGILVSTSGSIFYGGELQKYYDALYGDHDEHFGERIDLSAHSLNPFADSVTYHWADFTPKYVSILKCESPEIQFRAYGYVSTKTTFLNGGEIVFDVLSGKVNHAHNPLEPEYIESVWPTVYRLHFADYGDLGTLGNYVLKAIYFIMALITCFVIITGILIWLEARNKKNIPDKEKRYNQRVGNIYLAICLSMYPITAFTFIVSRLLPEEFNLLTETIFNSVYFGGWLFLSIYFYWKKDNYFTNKYTLLSGGILGLIIPIVNGFASGNWVWKTLPLHQYDIFAIDALWFFLGAGSLYAVYKLKKNDARKTGGTLNERKSMLKEKVIK
ncbi:PepSY-associated TM helix domain-containing protein [Chondrinema litorale]|uniref:PepSY-associated TM helix domain-containing protein n=1 Tax=Chondrinema litorale TaxID=2994555 RepID=UPI002542B6C6|nr:PepSY-associated TM helix domain-containing protein [Chondrinema litorale]UZR98513.1 PepSY-associated TM helix domain-containing protein [Chondrinema litorale]